MKWPSSWREVPLTSMGALLLGTGPDLGAWNAEPWRVSGMRSLEITLGMAAHATVDWLTGEVDLDVMHFHSAPLEKFWLQEVDILRMPLNRRCWPMRSSSRLTARYVSAMNCARAGPSSAPPACARVAAAPACQLQTATRGDLLLTCPP